jgi:hypothetical protein
MSIRERLEREIEKFKQTRGSMPVGVNELLLSDALEEIKRLTASESAPRTLLVADDPNAVACAAIVKLAEEQSRGDKNEWTGEHIEACKRAGWWLQEKSRGLPGYYPSEAMRAFKDGYDAGRSSLSHVGEQSPTHITALSPELQEHLEKRAAARRQRDGQPAITEAMVEAAAQRMVALVMARIIEKPQLVQWQQWSGSARAIIEAALEAAPVTRSATAPSKPEGERIAYDPVSGNPYRY